MTDPLTGNDQWCFAYSYDPNSNLATKTDPRNITTTYVYDALNRVTSRTYSSHPANTSAVTYSYDAQGVAYAKGRLTHVSSSVSVSDYLEYDALGRVKRSRQTTDGQAYSFSYTYNLAGQMTTQTYPSGRVIEAGYDNAGRIGAVKNHGTEAYYAGGIPGLGIQYAPHGAIRELPLGNGRRELTRFNSRLQPTQIEFPSNTYGSSLLTLDYAYGTTTNNGNVLSQTITIENPGGGAPVVMAQTYSYDWLNRISEARENNGSSWSEQFAYDRFGNMWVPSCSGITLSSLTPQNQEAFDAGTNRLTGGTNVYDSAGNQTMDAQGRRFTYDAENRQVSFNESVGRYYYDGDGRRVKKIDGNGTTIFVYNAGGQLIAEYTSGTPTAGDTSYLTTDHLGSTRVVTDSGGNVKARYDYLPFGEEIGQVGGRSGTLGYGAADNTRQKFTQKERDSESGLDYFLARYYSSVQGRFTSPDEFTGGPVELYKFVDTASANPTFYSDIFEPQSLNKYHYALNNPLRYVDRDGHQAQAEALRIGAAAAAGSRAGPAGAAGAVAGYLLYDNRKEIVEAIDHNERAKAELGQLFYEAVKNLYKKITGQQENQQEQPQQAQQQGEPQGQQGYSDEDLARMKQGRPPIGKDGNPKELHHPDQDTKKPVQPMTRTEHRGAGNSKQNHPVGNQRTSKIDRKKFKKERREYWRNEAKKEEERRRQSQ